MRTGVLSDEQRDAMCAAGRPMPMAFAEQILAPLRVKPKQMTPKPLPERPLARPAIAQDMLAAVARSVGVNERELMDQYYQNVQAQVKAEVKVEPETPPPSGAQTLPALPTGGAPSLSLRRSREFRTPAPRGTQERRPATTGRLREQIERAQTGDVNAEMLLRRALRRQGMGREQALQTVNKLRDGALQPSEALDLASPRPRASPVPFLERYADTLIEQASALFAEVEEAQTPVEGAGVLE